MLLMHTIRMAMPAGIDGFAREDVIQAGYDAFAAFGARDPIDQMLAAQAVAAHFAAMAYFQAAMNPDADERAADRARKGAVAMGRSMRDTIKMLEQRKQQPAPQPEPAPQANPEPPPAPQTKPILVVRNEVSAEDAVARQAAGTPQAPDFREKVLNGDPFRDFMSRHFLPGEDIEADGEEARRQSAAMEAADEHDTSRPEIG